MDFLKVFQQERDGWCHEYTSAKIINTTLDQVAEVAKEHGYTDIYRQSLIPMTEMQKLMGKSAFEEILGDLIYKPPGKPTLVSNTDKRPAMNVTNAENEFNEILED